MSVCPSSVCLSSVCLSRAALKSVKCGELSRAARILTSDGLIPPSPETEEQLKAKHPSQSEELRRSTVNTPQIDLKGLFSWRH